MAEANRIKLTIAAGTVAGLVAGLTISLALFEALAVEGLTPLGYLVLVIARGMALGTAGGLGAGVLATALCGPALRPHQIWIGALTGAICGSLAIFLPFPFHLPNEVMDLLMEPGWRA